AAEPARAEKTALQPVASAIFRVPKLSLFLEFCLFEHPSLIAKMQHVFQQSARLSLRGLGTGRPRRLALKARKIGPAASPCDVVWLWHAIGQSPANRICRAFSACVLSTNVS